MVIDTLASAAMTPNPVIELVLAGHVMHSIKPAKSKAKEGGVTDLVDSVICPACTKVAGRSIRYPCALMVDARTAAKKRADQMRRDEAIARGRLHDVFKR